MFGPDDTLTAVLVAKQPGVLCGMPAFAAAFEFLDAALPRSTLLRDDGDAARAGDEAARVRGPARAVLAAERTALNFATRLSGVATLTRRFVDAVAGTRCQVLDTRKTTPGWRALEKHAVRCGGGTNHRMGLYDAAMLKDTHLAAAGSLTAAVARVRERWGDGVPLVVECADLAMVEEALACKVATHHARQHGPRGRARRRRARRRAREARGLGRRHPRQPSAPSPTPASTSSPSVPSPTRRRRSTSP